jgi:hypothetical protein
MRATLTLLSMLYFSQVNAYSLPQHPIKSYDCDMCASLSHENLQDRWAIAATPLNKSSSNVQKSYSYDKRVTAEQLAQGVILPTHAAGAIVRITPLQNKAIPSLELKSASSPFMDLKEASTLYAQDDAINESLRTNAQQTVLQIKPELGMGNFTIKSKKSDPKNDAQGYLIHVYEKYALVYLEIEPSNLQYQYGDEFNALITLKDIDNSYPIDDINAFLLGPKQQTIPLEIKETKHNQFHVSTKLCSDENTHGENWYIEVEVSSLLEDTSYTYRTGHAAFSYSIPSASLISLNKIAAKPLTFTASVDVATGSRYALQAVLFTKNAMGTTIPLETTQSASWLKPGKQNINFSFDNPTQLAEDQLLIGYVRLTDYGQMKTVYQYDQLIKLSQFLD